MFNTRRILGPFSMALLAQANKQIDDNDTPATADNQNLAYVVLPILAVAALSCLVYRCCCNRPRGSIYEGIGNRREIDEFVERDLLAARVGYTEMRDNRPTI